MWVFLLVQVDGHPVHRSASHRRDVRGDRPVVRRDRLAVVVVVAVVVFDVLVGIHDDPPDDDPRTVETLLLSCFFHPQILLSLLLLSYEGMKQKVSLYTLRDFASFNFLT